MRVRALGAGCGREQDPGAAAAVGSDVKRGTGTACFAPRPQPSAGHGRQIQNTSPPPREGGTSGAVSPRGVCGLWWVLARQAGRPLCPLGSCHLLSSESHSTQGRPVRGQTLSAPARTPGRVPMVRAWGRVCVCALARAGAGPKFSEGRGGRAGE